MSIIVNDGLGVCCGRVILGLFVVQTCGVCGCDCQVLMVACGLC